MRMKWNYVPIGTHSDTVFHLNGIVIIIDYRGESVYCV